MSHVKLLLTFISNNKEKSVINLLIYTRGSTDTLRRLINFEPLLQATLC